MEDRLEPKSQLQIDADIDAIISFDIEAVTCAQGLGGRNGCLAVGLVAFRIPPVLQDVKLMEGLTTIDFHDQKQVDKLIVGRFCIYPKADAEPDPDTLRWWGADRRVDEIKDDDTLKRRKVWDEIKLRERPADEEMNRLAIWYHGMVKRFRSVKFVAMPGSYDWQWLNWLWLTYRQPVENGVKWPFKCLDGSMLMGLAKHIFENDEKRLKLRYPKLHDPLEDALRQGVLYLLMQRDLMLLIGKGLTAF